MTERTEYVVERKPTALMQKCPKSGTFEQQEVERFLVHQVIIERDGESWMEKRRQVAACQHEAAATSLCNFLNSLEAPLAEDVILSIIRLYVSTDCFGPPRLVAVAAE